jgi:site-specific DNA-adenine methylase
LELIMQIHTQPAPKVMSYYGSKYILARHYPTPRHPLIIEPFAGGAAYSLHHPEREVHLYDLNEKVCGVWDYIIRATPQEIIALPLLGAEDTVDALPAHLPQEARWMIGWWIKYALSAPCKSFSTNGKSSLAQLSASVWGERRRAYIAQTASRIKHWRVTNASYESVANTPATWFVDPPYACKAGRRYTHHAVDFPALAEWCREREGQVIVCENSDSPAWLPFTAFRECVGAQERKRTMEVWWTNTGEHLAGGEQGQLSLFDSEIM